MYYANDNATPNVASFTQHVHREMRDALDCPADLLAEDIHSDLYEVLSDEGYNFDNIEACRDLAVITEMIKAMLHRQNGHHHPYQEFLDQIEIAHNPNEI